MSGDKVPLIPLPPASARKDLREQMGITVADAASELQVSARTFSRWEHGSSPNPDNHRAYYALMVKWTKLIASQGESVLSSGN